MELDDYVKSLQNIEAAVGRFQHAHEHGDVLTASRMCARMFGELFAHRAKYPLQVLLEASLDSPLSGACSANADTPPIGELSGLLGAANEVTR